VRLSSLSLVGGLVAAATLFAGCEDYGPVAPPATPMLSASLDASGTDALPDSGAVVVVAQDGRGEGDGDGARATHLRALAVPDAVSSPGIRIGVVQAATAVTLGSAGDYTISDKANGLVLLTGSAGSVTVTLDNPPPPFWRLQVVCANTATVAVRKAAAEAAGYVTFTEFVGPPANCTRLYLGQFAAPPANTFAARTAFRNDAIARGFAGTDSFYRVVAVGTSIYKVARGTTVIASVNPIVITSTDGLVLINGVIYRAKAEARANGEGSLAGINELPVEEYLYGVVPRELGPIAFPEVEAQKAQAVAARTYAIAGLGKRASNGYDLRATTDDQVYGGYSAEHHVSSAAVDVTKGLVATHNGSLISALYHSTSGGHTADNDEAFSGVPAAYLRGVPDAQRGRALEHVPTLDVFRAHANPTSLRATKEGDLDSNWGRFHRWTFEWKMSEISEIISTFAGQPVGEVTAINVLERGPSGRVLRIEYVTDAGKFFSTKDQIRSSLKFINASDVATNLLSTLFFIEPIEDRKAGAILGYRAYGGGFGHGVGMSQTGAVGMAEKGHSYDEILRHYYRDIELTDWYRRSTP
jgi:stage II sporulation protein D